MDTAVEYGAVDIVCELVVGMELYVRTISGEGEPGGGLCATFSGEEMIEK